MWCSCELSFSLLLIATAFTGDGDGGDAAMVLGALTGINYAVHATNALLVAANIAVDPSKRASTIAMVTLLLSFPCKLLTKTKPETGEAEKPAERW